ncbi:MAG TPA: hypothetical protein VL328_07605 [Gemmatimonadaceae bacterium]|nr:hypothetical protein [Gemmatimonadaceae bacterium]
MSPPPPRPTLRRLRGAFTERLGLKATAFVLAVMLWVLVSAREPTEGLVRVRVTPVLDSSLVLRDGPPELRALVAGRAADLVKLYANPLVVRRTVGGDVPDTLVLDVAPSDVHIPAELSNAVRVLDVQPRSVTLRFETKVTREVPILNDGRIVVRTDSGLALADDVRFDPGEVRVTGPRRAVRQLRGIHPLSLAIRVGDTLPHVADLDTTGTGVRVQPMHVKVQLRPVAGALDSTPAAPRAAGDTAP